MDAFEGLEQETAPESAFSGLEPEGDAFAGLEQEAPQQEDAFAGLEQEEPSSPVAKSIVKPQQNEMVTPQPTQYVEEEKPSSVRISRQEAEALRKQIAEAEIGAMPIGTGYMEKNVTKRNAILKNPNNHPQTNNPISTVLGNMMNMYQDIIGDKDKKKGRTITQPITSNELDDNVFKNTNNPDEVEIDIQKLNYTYLPREVIMDVAGKQLLKYLGKDTPENLQQLKQIASIKGGRKGIVGATTEATDSVLSNIPSAAIIGKEIEGSVFVKREQGTDYLQIPAVKDEIDKAKKSGKSADLDDVLGVEIDVKPTDSDEMINDKIHKEIVTDLIGEYARMSERGAAQFAGSMIQNVLTGGLIGLAGKATTAVKLGKVAKIANSKVLRNPISRALTEASAESAMAYAGALGSDATKRKEATMAFAFSGAMNGLKAANRKTWRQYNLKTKLLEHEELQGSIEPNVHPYQHVIRDTPEYDLLPVDVKNVVSTEQFDTVKTILNTSDKVMGEVQEIAWKLNGEKINYDPRTQQHFKLWLSSDDARARETRDNIDLAQLYHSARTVDGTRQEKALLDTISDLNARDAVKELEAPIGSEINVSGKHSAILMKAEPLYNHPIELHQMLDDEYPELSLAFKNRLGSSSYKLSDFYWQATKAILNKPLDVNSRNIASVLGEFGGSQASLPALGKVVGMQEPPADYAARLQTLNRDKIDLTNGITDKLLRGASRIDDPTIANQVREYSNDLVNSIAANRLMTKGMKASIEQYLNLFETPFAISKDLDKLMKIQKQEFELKKEYANWEASRSNLNRTVQVDRQAKMMTDKNQILAYEITRQIGDNTQYINASLFRNDMDDSIRPAVTQAISLTQNLEPVDHLIAQFELITQRTDISPRNKYGVKAFISVLNKYETDRRMYQEAISTLELLHDQYTNNRANFSFPHFLAELNVRTRLISNPEMNANIRMLLNAQKPRFEKYIESKRIWLEPDEVEAMWSYLTGSPFEQIRVGAEHIDLLNSNTAESMFKAFNVVGRDLLDTYAGVYRETFGKDLDKDLFHSFFVTPDNLYDADSSVMKGMLGAYVSMRKDRQKLMNSSWFQAYLNMKGLDWFEQTTELDTELSAGPMWSALAQNMREGRLEVDKLLTDSLFEEGDGGYLKVLQDMPMYKEMENPILTKMIQRANLMQGHKAGVYIDTFGEDGSHSLTSFGSFVKSIYDDIDNFSKEIETQGSIDAAVINRFSRFGWSAEDLQKFADEPGLAEKYYGQASTYWNFFADNKAKEHFNMMLQWRAFQAKVDAKLLQIQNARIDFNNERFKAMDGAELQKIRFRNDRIRNRQRNSSRFDIGHTYNLAYEDSRIGRLYSTDAESIADRAQSLTHENLMHPLEQMRADISSRVVSSYTAHARSGLEAYAIGLSSLGFKNHSSVIFQKIGATPGGSMIVEYARPERWLQRMAAINVMGLRPIWQGFQYLISFAMPFGFLCRPSAIFKNNAQGGGFAFAYGQKTLANYLKVFTSPLRVIYMLPFYNKKGNLRVSLSSSETVKQIEACMSGVRDVVFKNKVSTQLEMAREGKVYDMRSVDGRVMAMSDALAGGTFRNTKERSELNNSRVAFETAGVIAEAIKKMLDAGKEADAKMLLQSTLLGANSSKIEWLHQNFVKFHKQGKFYDSLYPYLMFAHDHTVGRFGALANSAYIDQLNRTVPGAGLFFNAMNMVKFRMLSALETGLSKAPESVEKKFAPFISMFLASAAVYAGWQALEGGVRGTIEDLNLYKKKVTDLNSQEATWMAKVWEKVYSNGALSWFDATRFAHSDFEEYIKSITGKPGAKTILQHIGQAGMEVAGFGQLGRFGEMQMLGITFQRIGPNLNKMFALMTMPEQPSLDADGIIGAANFLGLGDAKLYAEYLKNPNSIEAKQAILNRYAAKYSERFARVADLALETLTPFTVVMDIASNPVTMWYWFQKLKQETQAYEEFNILEREVKKLQEAGIDQAGQAIQESTGYKPMQDLDDMSLIPVNAIGGLFNKMFGLDEVFDTSFYPSFVDSVMNWMINMQLIDSKLAERMKETNIKYYKQLNPEYHGQMPETPPWTEEDVKRGALDGGWKNPASIEELQKELDEIKSK